MSGVKILCARCGSEYTKPIGEINRSNRLGRKLYCSRSCAAHDINASKKSREIVKTCPLCEQAFRSSTKRRAALYCSRSCASRGSVTERVIEARKRGIQNLIPGNSVSISWILAKREKWKYVLLEKRLNDEKRDFRFEFELDGFVFDLAILDKKTLVEFDGMYHRGKNQQETDRIKDGIATRNGFILIRREVVRATIIDPRTIEGL